MSTPFKRTLAMVLAGCLISTAMLHDAQATMISTEAVARAQLAVPAQTPAALPGVDARAQLQTLLQRADVTQALQAQGVEPAAAAARVAALTDEEAALMVQQIDSAPAGGDLLGTLVFLFVLLLITDILGLTKIFPFTRTAR